MNGEMNVLALMKDEERFVFLYDDQSHDSLLDLLGRFASDPEINFDWYDVAMLTQKLRNLDHPTPRKQSQ